MTDDEYRKGVQSDIEALDRRTERHENSISFNEMRIIQLEELIERLDLRRDDMSSALDAYGDADMEMIQRIDALELRVKGLLEREKRIVKLEDQFSKIMIAIGPMQSIEEKVANHEAELHGLKRRLDRLDHAFEPRDAKRLERTSLTIGKADQLGQAIDTIVAIKKTQDAHVRTIENIHQRIETLCNEASDRDDDIARHREEIDKLGEQLDRMIAIEQEHVTASREYGERLNSLERVTSTLSDEIAMAERDRDEDKAMRLAQEKLQRKRAAESVDDDRMVPRYPKEPDITDRLRRYSPEYDGDTIDLCEEAADEIEGLRTELKDVQVLKEAGWCHVARLRRQRDEARTEIERLRGLLKCDECGNPPSYVPLECKARKERDEASAEIERLRRGLRASERLTATAEQERDDALAELERERETCENIEKDRDEARAEIEQLRDDLASKSDKIASFMKTVVKEADEIARLWSIIDDAKTVLG